MPKHLGILKLEHFFGDKALLNDVDTETSTLLIKSGSLAYGA